MKSLKEARRIIMAHLPKANEVVPLEQAMGRTASRDILSPMHMPPFHKAAVDGYACKRADLAKALICTATVHAGCGSMHEVGEGQCIKIMTGARVPKGADCVFMYEDAQVGTEDRVQCLNAKTKSNICYAGEDVGVGQTLVGAGTLLRAHHIAVLAGVGVVRVPVYRQLSVGIVATGTELVEPDQDAAPWQIRNSNSPLFMSLIPYASYYGIATDNKDEIKNMMGKAMGESDVLIVTGGASDSEFDLVPEVVSELGFEIETRKVAIQPGKPFLFAHNDSKKFCFGLSGNPVSAYVQFTLLVKSFLRIQQGLALRLPVMDDFHRRNAQRDLFVPVQILPDGVRELPYNGSAHIAAFAMAQGIMHVPQGVAEILKGEMVDVRQI